MTNVAPLWPGAPNLTALGWKTLEAARQRPLIERRENPGTIWSLSNRGLIQPAPMGTLVITDAGVALLRALEAALVESIAHLCPREGEAIHHIDGDPRNNSPENLRIVTIKDSP